MKWKFWKNLCKEDSKNKCCYNHSGNMVYGLGFIGALVFYISTATGFWVGVLGVLKAIVWPAMVVFHLLNFLI